MSERGRRRARTGAVAGALVAGAVAAGVAAERAFVRRDRNRQDPFADEDYGSIRGKAIGPVASFDGTLLNVESVGSGPTVVLSHGFSLGSLIWHHQMKDLSAEMRLVMYDQRGHGRSGRPPADDWSLEALARDLEAVLRDTAADEPVVLVGHSMGGMAVLKFCEMYPQALGTRVSGLVLVDTTSADVMTGVLPSAARRVSAAFQMLQAVAMRALAGRAEHLDRIRSRASDLSYLGTRLMGFGENPSPKQVDFLEHLLSEVPSDVWLGLIPSMLGLDVEHALPAIDVPALVVVGARDRLTPLAAAERIAENIADSELLVFPGAGHTPMLEQPERFNDALRAFLRRVQTTSARA